MVCKHGCTYGLKCSASCVCRLKLELPGIGARKPAEVPRPQLSTAVIAAVLLAAAAITVWTKLPHA